MRIVGGRAYLAAPIALALLLGLGGCGVAAAPSFEQSYGTVDPPCVGAASGASAPAGIPAGKTPVSCIAQVGVVNHGGAGSGYVTILVPIKTASGTAAQVQCVRSIPSTGSEDFAGLTCPFTLQPGETAAGNAVLSNLQSAGAASGGDAGGIATIVIAVVAGLLSLATLILALSMRRLANRGVQAPVGRRQLESEGEIPTLRGRPVDGSADPKLPW